MALLTLKDYTLTIAPEALTIKVFGVLWKRDRSVSKERALKELGYLYHMYNPSSDYRLNTPDEEERSALILKDEGIPPLWIEDRDMKNAIEYYKNSPEVDAAELQVLDTFITVLKNAASFCKGLKFEDQEDPIAAMKNTAATAKMLPDIMASIRESKRILYSTMDSGARVRGGGAKAIGEDGFDRFISNDK